MWLGLKFAQRRQVQPFLFRQDQEEHRRQCQDMDLTTGLPPLVNYQIETRRSKPRRNDGSAANAGDCRQEALALTSVSSMIRSRRTSSEAVSAALTACSTRLRVVYGSAGCGDAQSSPSASLHRQPGRSGRLPAQSMTARGIPSGLCPPGNSYGVLVKTVLCHHPCLRHQDNVECRKLDVCFSVRRTARRLQIAYLST